MPRAFLRPSPLPIASRVRLRPSLSLTRIFKARRLSRRIRGQHHWPLPVNRTSRSNPTSHPSPNSSRKSSRKSRPRPNWTKPSHKTKVRLAMVILMIYTTMFRINRPRSMITWLHQQTIQRMLPQMAWIKNPTSMTPTWKKRRLLKALLPQCLEVLRKRPRRRSNRQDVTTLDRILLICRRRRFNKTICLRSIRVAMSTAQVGFKTMNDEGL